MGNKEQTNTKKKVIGKFYYCKATQNQKIGPFVFTCVLVSRSLDGKIAILCCSCKVFTSIPGFLTQKWSSFKRYSYADITTKKFPKKIYERLLDSIQKMQRLCSSVFHFSGINRKAITLQRSVTLVKQSNI